METVAALGLKRRFEEVDSGSPCSTPKDSDDDISSNDSVDSCDSLNAPSSSLTPTSILRRQKGSLGRKQVRFDAVTVYYFSRRQGFTSVPSQGGSSLGMARHHCAIRQYTLGEFAQEQESSHRHILRQHLRQEKLNARKMKCAQADLLTLDDVSDEDLDVEGVEVDDCFFLQPLPTKRRRALLRASGIARIDAREKMELRAIRLSREECGCDCRFYCDPHQCVCSRAGIKCQVDRMSFPCGCSRDGCHNTAGRIEFNPLRVRTHYLHTIMKLDREKGPMSGSGLGEDHEEEPKLNPSAPCSPTGLDSMADSQVETPCEQELMEQCHSLEHENETAVLHLQSAEEQERRRACEEEVRAEAVQAPSPALCVLHEELHSRPEVAGMEEVEGVFIQEAFPEGATLLCVKDNQEEAPTLTEQASILYYQIDHVDTESLKAVTMCDGSPREGGEEPAEGANEPAEGKAEPVEDGTLIRGEKEESLSQTCKQDQLESPDSDHPPLSCMVNNDRVDEDHNFSAIECEGSCPLVEAGAIRLPPEV